jgi:hypothetical protein
MSRKRPSSARSRSRSVESTEPDIWCISRERRGPARNPDLTLLSGMDRAPAEAPEPSWVPTGRSPTVDPTSRGSTAATNSRALRLGPSTDATSALEPAPRRTARNRFPAPGCGPCSPKNVCETSSNSSSPTWRTVVTIVTTPASRNSVGPPAIESFSGNPLRVSMKVSVPSRFWIGS